MSVQRARQLFARAFGGEPGVIASAPGRVNLLGEHTDYNGGHVLPIATNARTCVAMRAAARGVSRAVSEMKQGRAPFSLATAAPTGEWWDYVAGPLELLASTRANVGDVDVAVVSGVPMGAGLSSSASLEVAVLMAACALHDLALDTTAIARLAHRAELEFVGVPCGIMDQFAVALAREGHALHLACDTGWTEWVPFSGHVLIFDTGVPRSLRRSAYAVRRAECDEALLRLQQRAPRLRSLAAATSDELETGELPEPLRSRARHVVEEEARVREAVAALRDGGRIPGHLLTASHESLRTLYECSSPELDWFVENVTAFPGVEGARLTGAGWGGCAIALGESDVLRSAAAELDRRYRERFPFTPRSWLTSAGQGALVEAQ